MARQDLSKLTRKAPAPGSGNATQGEEAPEQAPAPTVAAPAEPKTSSRKRDTQPAAAPTSTASAPSPAPSPAPVEAGTAAGEESRETASKGVPVHLPTSLNDRLQAYMTKTRKSHQTVLLDALEATYHQLPELIEKATSGDTAEEPQERASLFARPSRPAPVSSGEPRIKHTVRVSPTNRKILDSITAELEAPSRNLLIITAYEAFLPPLNEN